MTVATSPILELPKEGLPYLVNTDASIYHVGAERFLKNSEAVIETIGCWTRSVKVHEKRS